MSEARVAIIVLNYNGETCLLSCLRSLHSLSYKERGIFVVDNASTDRSLEKAQNEFPEYTYIRNNENLGFAGGMNVGIHAALKAGYEWVWLFNYDAQTKIDALSFLLEASEKSGAKMLSPVIEDSSGKVWFSRGKINFWRMRAEHIPGETKLSFYESEFLSGCALLIHRTVFEKIGFLDERFFLYYEDADFSLRARKAGFSCLVASKARVIHSEESRKSKNKLYYLVFSGLLFFDLHTSSYQKAYFSLYVTIRRVKNLIDVWLGREASGMVRKAYADYFSLPQAKNLPSLH